MEPSKQRPGCLSPLLQQPHSYEAQRTEPNRSLIRSIGLAGAYRDPGQTACPDRLAAAKHLEWDAPLAAAESVAWNMLEKELPLLEAMRVPRWFGGANSDDRLEIHGFSDASERAYAAVVMAKTKVL